MARFFHCRSTGVQDQLRQQRSESRRHGLGGIVIGPSELGTGLSGCRVLDATRRETVGRTRLTDRRVEIELVTTPIRLVIADDHPIVLNGLCTLFGNHAGTEVVARCANGDLALEAIRLHRPEVAILDLHMPELGGIEALRRIREERLPCRVVLLASAITDEEALQAGRLAVDGVALKALDSELLLECVHKVAAGERWLEKQSAGRLIDNLLRATPRPQQPQRLLTTREIELIQLVAAGLRNKEISQRLRIQEGTVKIHLHNIYEKLEIENRVQLLLYAQARGIA